MANKPLPPTPLTEMVDLLLFTHRLLGTESDLLEISRETFIQRTAAAQRFWPAEAFRPPTHEELGAAYDAVQIALVSSTETRH